MAIVGVGSFQSGSCNPPHITPLLDSQIGALPAEAPPHRFCLRIRFCSWAVSTVRIPYPQPVSRIHSSYPVSHIPSLPPPPPPSYPPARHGNKLPQTERMKQMAQGRNSRTELTRNSDPDKRGKRGRKGQIPRKTRGNLISSYANVFLQSPPESL